MNNAAEFVFADREEASRLLLSRLDAYRSMPEVAVVSLPQGGLCVGAAVARSLGAALDIVAIPKLGLAAPVPAALAHRNDAGGKSVGNEPDPILQYCLYSFRAKEERETPKREAFLRSSHPALPLKSRPVLFVDDGSATRNQLALALKSIRAQRPVHLAAAFPITCRETVLRLNAQVNEIIHLVCTESSYVPADYYRSLPNVGDDEIRATLLQARTSDGDTPCQTQAACG